MHRCIGHVQLSMTALCRLPALQDQGVLESPCSISVARVYSGRSMCLVVATRIQDRQDLPKLIKERLVADTKTHLQHATADAQALALAVLLCHLGRVLRRKRVRLWELTSVSSGVYGRTRLLLLQQLRLLCLDWSNSQSSGRR